MHTDFLVIGSGLAGMNAALELAAKGRVIILNKGGASDSATAYAQGGIASVTAGDDSIDSHVADTLEAGAGLCDPNVAHSIIAEGPDAIASLISRGVEFDKGEKGYDLTREGGHSARRILHAKDITGREIDRALRSAVEQSHNITVLTHHIAIDLITHHKLGKEGANRCLGAYVLNKNTGKVISIAAGAVLIACGGAGKVYLYTSNPDVATGDGVAMAWRAGAEIANMEFFQFHPTCLFHPHAKSFLISEALRGEGGVLRNAKGEQFMLEVDRRADLAPRDIVARAIDKEMKRGGEEHLFLDMTAKDPAFIASRFPNIHTACLSLGIDMTKTPIPIVPAAHYMCGGVRCDLSAKSSLEGLWVAGESAYTGLHGANRLASNSLLEAAVMSKRAAAAMVKNTLDKNDKELLPAWDSGSAASADEAVIVSHNWDELRRTMWNYVGIVRSAKRLSRAAARITLLQQEIDAYYWDFKITSELIELRNLATVAKLIVDSAQQRTESRGLHYRVDTPATDASQKKPTLLRLNDAS